MALGIVFTCLTIILVAETNSMLSNATQRILNGLPEIKEGETCVPNKVYRMECNTCKCDDEGNLICTKMSCLSQDQMDRIQRKMQKQKEQEKEQVKLKLKQSLREKSLKEKRRFPELPEGSCVPGKFYQKDCYGCYCEDGGSAVCSEERNVCDPERILQVPRDFRPQFHQDERDSLPSLPTMGSRCQPGKAYKVSCNTCLCLPNYSLICDQLLCISFEDMNRIEADRMTGTPCKSDKDVASSPCVKCTCANETAKCAGVPNCERSPTILRQLHGQEEKIKPVMTLNLETDHKCLPQAVYKSNCNRCYCQIDGSLRCTQKVCLNYVESLKLKKRRLYLEKHGL